MSTKTTIKRVALVAVAALGFGMLSTVPSQAVAGTATLTTTTGSASVTSGAAYETGTAATITINGLLSNALDSYTVTAVKKSGPAASSSVAFRLALADTTTAGTVVKRGATDASTSGYAFGADGVAAFDSTTTFTTGVSDAYTISQSVGYAGAKFGLILDSSTTRVAGTYVYTVMVQAYEGGSSTAKTGGLQTADLTFTISDTAANVALASGTIDPSKTTAWMNAGATPGTAADSSVVAVATAAATNHAVIQVKTYTATSLAAPESVTVTLTGAAGIICDASGAATCGSSLKVAGTGGSTNFYVRANGVAGTSTIVVATTTKTFPAKTVTFYAKSPSTITTTVNKPVIGVAAASSNTDVVRAVAKDANGNNWAGQLYIVASAAADALIAGSATTPTACTYNATYGFHACPLKGTAKGTASVKVMDASLDTDGTIATTDAAVTSAASSVRVSTGSASSVKIAFDKATYAPGEKAYVTVRVLDENGDAMPAGTITGVFASAPTTNVTTGTVTPAFSADVAIAGATDAVTDPNAPTNAGAQTYVVYMPTTQGTVTISATGSTGLAASGRVAVSASADVVNDDVTAATDAANEATDAANAATDAANAAAEAADAATAAAQDAQAAVAALATQVSSLIAGIKAQITSLTNLVIKIQKKVKA